MPHMDGEAAFKAMRAIRPDARIIVSSGYSEQDISERFTLDAKVTFIQKPYARGPLVAALKKVLGEKPPPAG
jgi:YesN/AraC family two-component response regulator